MATGLATPDPPNLANVINLYGGRRGHDLATSLGMRLLPLVALTLSFATACAMEVDDEGLGEHEEVEDFVVDPADGKSDGVPATFDANTIVSDPMLTTATAMTVDDVQAFFEKSPYNNRSWLASYSEDGVSAAELIVRAAVTHDVNPLILIARMQVETSMVSKTVQPTQRTINRALGCGCPDGASCNPAYSGLQKQLDCGARIMRKWYDGSIDGTGAWKRGVSKSTLDPRRVTPANHATASFYAYTPWVLVGRGGCWLAWNVTRKYVRHAEATGLLTVPE